MKRVFSHPWIYIHLQSKWFHKWKRDIFSHPPPFRSDWKSLRNEKGVFLVTPIFHIDFQSNSIWLKILDKSNGGLFSHPWNVCWFQSEFVDWKSLRNPWKKIQIWLGVFFSRTSKKNGSLAHTLNPRIFTLDPTTPQILWSKMLSGMIWKVSKLSQNEKIYMFLYLYMKSFYEQTRYITCKFDYFDSILRQFISFPINFLIEIFEECLD